MTLLGGAATLRPSPLKIGPPSLKNDPRTSKINPHGMKINPQASRIDPRIPNIAIFSSKRAPPMRLVNPSSRTLKPCKTMHLCSRSLLKG
jgi:hypothetical protein